MTIITVIYGEQWDGKGNVTPPLDQPMAGKKYFFYKLYVRTMYLCTICKRKYIF